MASNLPSATCIGQHSVCIMRVAQLDTDCTPMGGTDTAYISTGIVSATIEPVIEEGRRLEPKNGCGRSGWTYVERSRWKSSTLSGELLYHDFEAYKLLFGGTTILGKAGGPYAGKVIGWAAPDPDAADPAPVYVEFIVRNIAADAGECVSGTAVPYATGYIAPRAMLVPQTFNLQADNIPLSFTGPVTANPRLFDGPWNDWVGTGVIPNTPMLEAQYSLSQYEAIAALATCGHQASAVAS